MLRSLVISRSKWEYVDVKVVGNEALFMNVNEVVHEIGGVNVVPVD